MSKKLANKKLVLVSIAAVLAGIFLTLEAFENNTNVIYLAFSFYLLCIWAWRVIVPIAGALALWQYAVPPNTAYSGRIVLSILAAGIALGIFWQLRHQKNHRQNKEVLDVRSR